MVCPLLLHEILSPILRDGLLVYVYEERKGTSLSPATCLLPYLIVVYRFSKSTGIVYLFS